MPPKCQPLYRQASCSPGAQKRCPSLPPSLSARHSSTPPPLPSAARLFTTELRGASGVKAAEIAEADSGGWPIAEPGLHWEGELLEGRGSALLACGGGGVVGTGEWEREASERPPPRRLRARARPPARGCLCVWSQTELCARGKGRDSLPLPPTGRKGKRGKKGWTALFSPGLLSARVVVGNLLSS